MDYDDEIIQFILWKCYQALEQAAQVSNWSTIPGGV